MANYRLMWEQLKEVLPKIADEGDMIHLGDLERVMTEVEDDWSDA